MSLNLAVNLKSLPGPDDVTRLELPNGITLLTRSNFDSPSVVVSGYLPAGSMFDPREKLGLAHFTALTLMRGSQRRSFQELFDARIGRGILGVRRQRA
jgi:zinc protease